MRKVGFRVGDYQFYGLTSRQVMLGCPRLDNHTERQRVGILEYIS